MFFIGVFGIENRDKEITELNNFSCPKCKTSSTARLIKNFDFFHFFFIPIFKWNENYYVVCGKCNSPYSVPKEKGKSIERGENISITYWDLQEINQDGYNDNYYQGNICRECGSVVEKNFKYCPHCGRKI